MTNNVPRARTKEEQREDGLNYLLGGFTGIALLGLFMYVLWSLASL